MLISKHVCHCVIYLCIYAKFLYKLRCKKRTAYKPYRTYICLKDLISDIASKIAETKSKLVDIKCNFYIKVYEIPHLTNKVGRHKFPIARFIKMKKKNSLHKCDIKF